MVLELTVIWCSCGFRIQPSLGKLNREVMSYVSERDRPHRPHTRTCAMWLTGEVQHANQLHSNDAVLDGFDDVFPEKLPPVDTLRGRPAGIQLGWRARAGWHAKMDMPIGHAHGMPRARKLPDGMPKITPCF